MKQLLVTCGLLLAALLVSCSSDPDRRGDDGCEVCAAQQAVQTAIPDAPDMDCAKCVKHEMLAACPKCEEMGKPCCEKCAAKMKCPACESAGETCQACEIATADCTLCAVKGATWAEMACPECQDGEGMCAKCTELKAKLDGVECADCKG